MASWRKYLKIYNDLYFDQIKEFLKNSFIILTTVIDKMFLLNYYFKNLEFNECSGTSNI